MQTNETTVQTRTIPAPSHVICEFCTRRHATVTIHVNRRTQATCDSCAYTVLDTERR